MFLNGYMCDQMKMTQPGCTKMAISQLLLSVASSNLVSRKSKCYLIIKLRACSHEPGTTHCPGATH